jgi:anti-anti-sigma regulatory factor
MLETLSREFDLHVFDHPEEPRSPVVSWQAADDVTVGVLRGEFDLISAEAVIDLMLSAAESGSRRIELDVTGVTRARTVAGELLRGAVAHLERRGIEITFDGNID